MNTAAWLVLVGFVVVMLARAARRGLQMKRLLEDGVTASGTVVSKQRFNTRPGRRFFVRYEYRDQHGATHTQRALVTRDVYNRLTEGDPVEVVYSAGRPEIAALRSDVEVLRTA